MLERTQLNQIKVASPCKADWNQMTGDEQMRFCGQCNLHVYNLSAMSLREVEQLVSKKEGRTCVRFFRRADGTVITDDCPVGLRAVRRKLALVATAAAGLLTAATAGFGTARGAMGRSLRTTGLARVPAIAAIANWLDGRSDYEYPAVMGKIAMPRPPRACGTPVIKTSQPSPVAIMGDYATPLPPPPSAAPVASMGEPMPLLVETKGEMLMPVRPPPSPKAR